MKEKRRFSSSKNKIISTITPLSSYLFSETPLFLSFLQEYLNKKSIIFSKTFEENKNFLVRSVLLKRGRLNRMFLHVCAMIILCIGVILSPFISDVNPFTKKATDIFAQESQKPSPLASDDVFQTQASDSKIRNKIITYTVIKGDTLSIIAEKFGISEDTIKWENDLKSDSITVGDELRILPVTGVAHKVARGDTVYTIAKKYDTNPQGIVDFPFNDFANPQTFSLIEGQILIVPDGIIPEEKPRVIPRKTYIATGTSPVIGGFAWPVRGLISQFYSWYHPGIDITGPIGTPILSATDGTVSAVYTSGWNGGYGIHVIINGSNGYTTLYSHMSGVNVSVGQSVTAGSTIVGWIGMTGRTTGPHVHFEVRNGGNVNPMAFLR